MKDAMSSISSDSVTRDWRVPAIELFHKTQNLERISVCCDCFTSDLGFEMHRRDEFWRKLSYDRIALSCDSKHIKIGTCEVF